VVILEEDEPCRDDAKLAVLGHWLLDLLELLGGRVLTPLGQALGKAPDALPPDALGERLLLRGLLGATCLY